MQITFFSTAKSVSKLHFHFVNCESLAPSVAFAADKSSLVNVCISCIKIAKKPRHANNFLQKRGRTRLISFADLNYGRPRNDINVPRASRGRKDVIINKFSLGLNPLETGKYLDTRHSRVCCEKLCVTKLVHWEKSYFFSLQSTIAKLLRTKVPRDR
jgi:hypothetical protein